MADKLKNKQPTRRDAVDAARLKLAGDPSHINAREDALLRRIMPEAHGRVVTSGLLAEAGRLGDDRVTLLIPEEAALLKARGGAGTVNPASGLLEYNNSGDSDDGSSSNTSSAGENTGGMDGTANSGVSEGPGANGGYGSNDGGYGGWGGYDRTPAVESLLAAPNFAMPGVSFTQYAPRDTWGRAWQEWVDPHPAAMRATPGRYGMPNAMGPGLFGTAINSFVGGPFGAVMGVGAALGRAQSMEQQDASIAHNQEQGAKNSTGQDRDRSTGLSFAELDARNVPGAASGSNTAGLLGEQLGVGGGTGTAPGGVPAVAPGGLMPTDERNNTLTGLPVPVQNLLQDYIWRGRQGGGFGW